MQAMIGQPVATAVNIVRLAGERKVQLAGGHVSAVCQDRIAGNCRRVRRQQAGQGNRILAERASD